MPPVRSLGLSMSISANFDITSDLSQRLGVLRLHIKPVSRELTDDETIEHITPIVDKIIALPKLRCLYVSLPDIMVDDIERLVRYALTNNLRNCCVRVSQEHLKWIPQFERQFSCSCFDPMIVEILNRAYQLKLNQVMAIEKSKRLRNIASIFKEQLLEYTNHHEIG